MTDKQQKIYLDYAATTPVDERVVLAMQPYWSNAFGNASSFHGFGQAAAQAVDGARDAVAKILNCRAQEVIFTSGATESNNLLLRGLVAKHDQAHIITSTIEHPSILATCAELEKFGRASVTYVPVNDQGLINVEEVIAAIKPQTVVISIMLANNEIGAIQPIREIGKALEKINQQRLIQKLPAIIFHTDAVQGFNYLNVDVKHLHVQALSFSAHKIYGPKGVGVLYVNRQLSLLPAQTGGGQEYGLRSGSLNVAGIVGLGRAVEILLTEKDDWTKKVLAQRQTLWQGLQKNISGLVLNGSAEQRLPNNLNISLAGLSGESLAVMLDLAGLAVSVGSACATGSVEPSHVLTALGYDQDRIRGSLRLTLGRPTTNQEIDQTIKIFEKIVTKARS